MTMLVVWWQLKTQCIKRSNHKFCKFYFKSAFCCKLIYVYWFKLLDFQILWTDCQICFNGNGGTYFTKPNHFHTSDVCLLYINSPDYFTPRIFPCTIPCSGTAILPHFTNDTCCCTTSKIEDACRLPSIHMKNSLHLISKPFQSRTSTT